MTKFVKIESCVALSESYSIVALEGLPNVPVLERLSATVWVLTFKTEDRTTMLPVSEDFAKAWIKEFLQGETNNGQFEK